MPKIRLATTEDASLICELLRQLGYMASVELMGRKVSTLTASPMESVLVAEEENGLSGVISLHVLELFHCEGRLGRVTSLVVDTARRRNGVGRLLVEAAERFFMENGCVRAEVTSGDQRKGAHDFYRSVGFVSDEMRFVKRYMV